MQDLALVASGLFAGASIYVTFVEHPARMECGTLLAATVFGPSYRRAAGLQATLALIGSAAGAIAWQLGSGLSWLSGSIVLFFVVPFTLLGIMETNKRLLDPGLERASREAWTLLTRWGRLHAVRSLAGGLSFVTFVLGR